MKLKGLLIGTGTLAILLSAHAVCAQEDAETLSNDYIVISQYEGVEIEPVTIEETDDDDVDKVVNYMLRSYARENDLDSDALELTDELAATLSDGTAETVEEYREQLYDMICETRTDSAADEEETRVWEVVLDNTEVLSYPEERLQHELDNLKDLYDSYAAMDGVTYEEYMENIGLTEDDLEEAAEASMKQILTAELLADTLDLYPTDEELEEAYQDYVDEYNLTNVDVLKATIDEDDLDGLILRHRVKSWLREHCIYKEAEETDSEDSARDSDTEVTEEEAGAEETETKQ